MEQLIDAAVWYVAFLFSTTLHEAAHALAALRGGDPTAYRGGQVSIDPLPHIRREPVGMLILPIASVLMTGWPMGFASAPYDPIWASHFPRRAAWMALAGPAANLFLLLGSAIAIRLGLAAGVFEVPLQVGFGSIVEAASPGLADGAAMLLGVFFTLNLILFVFNLMPVPPLDGASAITLLLPEQLASAVRGAMTNPMFAYVGLMFAWFVFPRLMRPAFWMALGWLYPVSP